MWPIFALAASLLHYQSSVACKSQARPQKNKRNRHNHGDDCPLHAGDCGRFPDEGSRRDSLLLVGLNESRSRDGLVPEDGRPHDGSIVEG
jgi:hypothetical protein